MPSIASSFTAGSQAFGNLGQSFLGGFTNAKQLALRNRLAGGELQSLGALTKLREAQAADAVKSTEILDAFLGQQRRQENDAIADVVRAGPVQAAQPPGQVAGPGTFEEFVSQQTQIPGPGGPASGVAAQSALDPISRLIQEREGNERDAFNQLFMKTEPARSEIDSILGELAKFNAFPRPEIVGEITDQFLRDTGRFSRNAFALNSLLVRLRTAKEKIIQQGEVGSALDRMLRISPLGLTGDERLPGLRGGS